MPEPTADSSTSTSNIGAAVSNIYGRLFGPAQAPAPAPAPAATPAAAPAAAAPVAPNSSLDQFTSLLQTPVYNDKNPAPADPLAALAQPLLAPDPAKLAAAARNLSFTQMVPNELVTKALGGDAESLQQILNTVGQQSFTMALQSAAQATNGALAVQTERIKAALPTLMRDYQMRTTPVDDPILSHPTMQPIVENVRANIAANHPSLSPAEINAKVKSMFAAMATEMSGASAPAQQAAKQQDAKAGSDFSGW